MKDLRLYSEITSLPSDLKQEVSDFVAFLKRKSKLNLSNIRLNGPVFSEAQINTIEETRKSINEWRTK